MSKNKTFNSNNEIKETVIEPEINKKSKEEHNINEKEDEIRKKS